MRQATQLTVTVSERDHVHGPASAPVTLVEYGDFECPHCAEAHGILQELEEIAGKQFRLAFRHFPLATVHPHAQNAAEAAAAAGAQGKFWEMHDLLFERQDALELEDLAQYAADLDLDVERFLRELEEHVHAARVRQDFLSGARSGVNGTPTFFINGVRHDGSYQLESLLAAIENE